MRKFSDIIGQKAIIEHLYNALRTGSVSHAYIISGDAGSGRKTIASIFAAALQCEDLQEEELEPGAGYAGARNDKGARVDTRNTGGRAGARLGAASGAAAAGTASATGPGANQAGARTGAASAAAAATAGAASAAAAATAGGPSAAATAAATGPGATAAAASAAAASAAAQPAAPSIRIRPRLLEPCGRCLSCIQVESGNQPDIITITHEKTNSIGVNEIRRMRADLQIKPYSNARKIYIIPDAEKLTIQAQNALLKTLEEPPEYAVIILIANGLVSFLPTVLSRCVVLQTRAVEEAQIAQLLQREKGIPEEQASILARFAGGNPGQALLLTEDREFLELRDRTVDFLAHLSRANAVRISEFSSGIDGGRREEVLSFVLMWFRDVLLYHSTQNSENLIFQEDIQYIIEAAEMLGYERLGRILEEVDTASRRLGANVQADSVFEVMFLKIRQQYRRR